ncbi:MAG: carboxypeptidase regulatory-like domain-containing protein [Candidatus Heimdallarchaeota archaeon]|nr:carboxypeptidase regulatory-like domain-containing protein [Candidatus Heimdallarchaeota archaeon]
MKIRNKSINFVIIVLVLAGTMITVNRIEGTSNFQGTVENCSDNPLSGAGVVLTDCYFNILGSDTTDSSGNYDFDVTLNGNSPYYLTASKSRFTTGMKVITSGGTNDFELVGNGENIAIFVYTSDVCMKILLTFRQVS